MHIATKYNSDSLKLLIDAFPQQDLSVRDVYGNTVLHSAVRYNKELLKLLIYMLPEKVKYLIGERCGYYGKTVLHYAVRNKDLLKPLLDAFSEEIESLLSETNKSTFENIIKLPNSVTLGFSPYPDDVTELIARAADLGFEAIIKIPMQTKSYPMEDLGPYTLLDDLSDYENDSRVQIVFSRSDDIVGVYANPGEIITDYIDNVRHILKSFAILLDASKNPLVFLYSDEYDKKPITRAAAELNIMENICLIDIALDNVGSSEDILEKIVDLEMIAKSRGVSVGIIRPYQANIEILQKWMETLEEKQIEIKPLTLFMKERFKIASGN